LETQQQLETLQQQQQQWQWQQLSSSTGVSVAGRPASPTAEYSLQQLLLQQQAQQPAAAAAVGRLPEQRSMSPTSQQQQQQRGTAAVVQVSDEELLQRSFEQWLWVVRGKALLVRVFAGAESAWQAQARLDVVDVLDAGG
jgi:hypothetical protein